jgi:hypothetical protein
MTASELELHTMVADYLRLQYPNVLFHSDFGSGAKLTPNQAVRQKRLNGGRRAWPDLFIAAPNCHDVPALFTNKAGDFFELLGKADNAKVGGKTKFKRLIVQRVDIQNYDYHFGLFIELKKEGTRLKKKDGTWATEHIAEQAAVLEELRKRGYAAEFAVGFEHAKGIIDTYLGARAV